MSERILNVGEIRKVIMESSSEFKARMGQNVETDNKKNNDKSYKDTEKEVKNYDGGLKDKEKKVDIDRSQDINCGILDYNPVNEPSKEYKARVKAQAKGYTSVEDEKRGSKDKNADFDDDAKIYKAMKKNADVRNAEKQEIAHSGIVGSNTEKKDINSMYESKTLKPKRLVFKKTIFVNEKQMLSRIPEEYKVDGQVIYMKDKNENEYIVECVKNEKAGFVETNILNFNNEKILNEQVSRMNALFEYDSKKTFNTKTNNNDGTFNDMLNLSRGLNK